MLTAEEIIKNADVGTIACTKAAQSGALPLFDFLCGWEALAGLALGTSVVLLAMIFLFSVLFRNEGLKNFVKLELSELFITVVLIIMLVTGVRAVSDIQYSTFAFAGKLPAGVSKDANIYNVTEIYFNEVGQDMAEWLELNYIMGVYVDSMASVTPYARPLGVGLVASPLAGLASPFKQLLYNMSTALSVAFIINFAQLYVFLFSLLASLHYYIPLGIILRSFTPTRKIGGAFIGLGLAFLFMFPVLYSFDYMMFYSADASPMVTFRAFIKDQMSTSKGLFGSGGDAEEGKIAKFYDENYSTDMVDLVTESIAGIGRLLNAVIGKFFTLLMVFPLATIGRAFAIGFIIPAFNTLLMIQATRYLSRAIGQEVDISTLTRLI